MSLTDWAALLVGASGGASRVLLTVLAEGRRAGASLCPLCEAAAGSSVHVRDWLARLVFARTLLRSEAVLWCAVLLFELERVLFTVL